MVGVSAKPDRPSNFVATYLLSSSTDYDVYFVNPAIDEILGRPSYPSLSDLPEKPDLVDVFRRLEDVPGVADEAVEVGASVFWTQFGLWSVDAAQRALAGGLEVVMDRCLKVEHARFHGGLHLAGFDTGVINSRRRGA
ncbi:MAG: CoA-binding protein [Acidimicrobiia bacterium]|nr:CoA-binding protein [Actinomycetota bacterium]MBL6925658.1 CoA-binding protein [Acidimicrobiia bacterium]